MQYKEYLKNATKQFITQSFNVQIRPLFEQAGLTIKTWMIVTRGLWITLRSSEKRDHAATTTILFRIDGGVELKFSNQDFNSFLKAINKQTHKPHYKLQEAVGILLAARKGADPYTVGRIERSIELLTGRKPEPHQ